WTFAPGGKVTYTVTDRSVTDDDDKGYWTTTTTGGVTTSYGYNSTGTQNAVNYSQNTGSGTSTISYTTESFDSMAAAYSDNGNDAEEQTTFAVPTNAGKT
ncbi:MAG TPA: hypothetical protein VGN88_12370, partial [Phycisphaerae bacterium]